MKFLYNLKNSGTFLIVSACLAWGFSPIYFKLINMVPPLEILCHRVLWSFAFLFILIIYKKQLHNVKEIFLSPKILFLLTCTTAIIAANWFTFIWGIVNEHLMEVSLGSFMIPIFNILLGIIFLKEKTNLAQKISLIITIIAILVQISEISFKGFAPFISIALASTFSLYGLIRKQTQVNSIPGLIIETLFLSPLAIIYLLYLAKNNQLYFFNSPKISFLLLLSGFINSVPLLLFISGSKLLPMSKVGFYQYISPTVNFLLAIFIYKEKMNLMNTISIVLVWIALFIFISSNLRENYQSNKKLV